MLQKGILLRMSLVVKLLLRDDWHIYMAFPNLLYVLGIPVRELNRAPSYNFSLFTTILCWYQRNSW